MQVLLFSLLTGAIGAQAAAIGPRQSRKFNLQGHRGSRGETSESTIAAFAWALIDGVTTLELDNGITKDGVAVVWHDEAIVPEKCRDTAPVTANDPTFPYVGKNIQDLTLAQIKTLDCGSQRLAEFPLQLNYPGTKISTLREVFQFAACADPFRQIQWNVESKINPVYGNTRTPEDFVNAQLTEFLRSGYKLSQITYQSFDWRTLVLMQKREPKIPISALLDPISLTLHGGTYPLLAGLNLADFPGGEPALQAVHAAKSIGASVLSPATGELSSLFTTKAMVDQAHALGLTVVPWTVNRLDVVERLLELGVDGLITDYPRSIGRLLQQKGYDIPSGSFTSWIGMCAGMSI
ncbi:PLC-like phosphodiesterase [Coprinopsis marcescibilis]|uniref:PLC-like phosphodiesterase n=1 Tax=Coprinopsis marcescibilis TaxID=230819 RepID=A0A5C3LCM6_COPMA|nr:PLC-like phosphodiesterase [Coprinopsis marcescibilis]